MTMRQVSKEKNRYTEHCMMCGSPLEYLDRIADLQCSDCGKIESGHIHCPGSHYLCETCHGRQSAELIKELCFSTDVTSPLEIAEEMMAVPQVSMLGCQHALIGVGALMAAIRNDGTLKLTNRQIEEAFKRTERQAIGGYCGLTGVCGIVPGVGACFAILLNSKCGTDREQRLTMEVVSNVVQAIADLTGPSCCKAYVRSSLSVAVQFLKDNFDVNLPCPSAPVRCQYDSRHPHGCRGTKCPYFPKSNAKQVSEMNCQ